MVTPNRNVFKFATLALIWILAITSLITKTSRNKLRLLENYSESLKPNFKKSELDLIIGIKHKVHPPPNLTKVSWHIYVGDPVMADRALFFGFSTQKCSKVVLNYF